MAQTAQTLAQTVWRMSAGGPKKVADDQFVVGDDAGAALAEGGQEAVEGPDEEEEHSGDDYKQARPRAQCCVAGARATLLFRARRRAAQRVSVAHTPQR
jgi:hypothetical protein